MSAKTIDRYVTSTICHEWGHVLVHYLLYGTVKNISEIQFIDSLARMDAHTVYQPYYAVQDEESGISVWEIQTTKVKDVMIRLAGALACKICGFTGFTRIDYDSTDAITIRRLIPNKTKVAALRAQTEELLLPLKEALIRLTASTLDYYPQERDENNHVHFSVPGPVVHSWVDQVIPDEMKPKEVCASRMALKSIKRKEMDENGNVVEIEEEIPDGTKIQFMK
jgi:hypothetical protein